MADNEAIRPAGEEPNQDEEEDQGAVPPPAGAAEEPAAPGDDVPDPDDDDDDLDDLTPEQLRERLNRTTDRLNRMTVQADRAVGRAAVWRQQAHGNPTVIAAVEGGTTNKMPKFVGKSARETAEHWLETLRSLKELHKWNDQQTMKVVQMSLTEDAAEWRKSMQRRGEPFAGLEDFEAKFLDRYQKKKTAADLVTLSSNLKQTAAEPVKEFYDRTWNQIAKAHETTIKALPTEAEKTAAKKIVAGSVRNAFVSGLQPGIQTPLNTKLYTLTDMNQVVNAAIEIEAALKPATAALAVMQGDQTPSNPSLMTFEDMRRELHALGSQFRAGGGRGTPPGGGPGGRGRRNGAQRRGTRGTGRGPAPQNSAPSQQPGSSGGARPRAPFVPDADKIRARTEWVFCYRCFTWGKHLGRECRATDQEIHNTPNQNGKIKPAGTPRDRFFH